MVAVGVCLAVMVGALLALGACSSARGSVEAPSPLRTVKEGTLTVLADPSFPPLIMKAKDSDKVQGFEAELLTEAAKRLGLKIEIRSIGKFDGLGDALLAGEGDVGASALTITPERQERVGMSVPYMDSNQSLLVRGQDAGSLDLDDFKGPGHTVVVLANSTGEAWVHKHLPEADVVSQDDPNTALTGLQAGLYDGAIFDSPIARYLTNNVFNDISIAEVIPTEEQLGFMVPKDNVPLTEAINRTIETMGEDGTIASLETKWFGTVL